jgi:hypothetical protein
MWNTKHVVIDDFLEKKHFDFLTKVDFGEIKGKDWKNYANSVQNGKVVKLAGEIPEEILLEMDKTYTPRLLKILEDLVPGLSKKYKHTEITLTAIGKDLIFHVHTDKLEKILSVVVYIYPEKNCGTLLYNEKIDSKNGTDESSWHNYRADGKSPRVVLVYNLRNDNPKNNLKEAEADKAKFYV